jgi:hypothetical protein
MTVKTYADVTALCDRIESIETFRALLSHNKRIENVQFHADIDHSCSHEVTMVQS